MLGLALLMVTFLAFPLWCMVGAAGTTDAFSTTITSADPDADANGAHS